MASREQRNVLLAMIALVTAVECCAWFLACVINLALRTGEPFGPVYTPERVTQNTEAAVVVTTMLVLNTAATIAFFFRSRGFGLPLLAAVQGANIVAVIALLNAQISNAWPHQLTLSAAPAFTLLLLAVLWRFSPRQPPNPVPGPDV